MVNLAGPPCNQIFCLNSPKKNLIFLKTYAIIFIERKGKELIYPMTKKRFNKLMRAFYSKQKATDNRNWADIKFGTVLSAGKFRGVVLNSYQIAYDYFMYLMTEYRVWDDIDFEEDKK